MPFSQIKRKVELKSESGLSTGAIVAIVLGSITLVITVIGVIIVGLVAAPAYVNQNQRSNDAAVESDVRNVATSIETALIETPNAERVEVLASEELATVFIEGQKVSEVTLDEGVTVETVDVGSANGYVLHGFHKKGAAYIEGEPLIYDSASGGFTN